MAATSRTVNFDALLSTTMDKYRPKMIDNILLANPFIAWLMMKDRYVPQDGGASLIVPVMYGKNTTIGSFAGYDQLDITPQQGMTVAIYPWRNMAGTISISTDEKAKNNGEAQLINLLSQKIEQAEGSMREECNRLFFLDGTGNAGKDPYGLNLLVEDAAGASWLSNVAGIDRTTEAWWRNQWATTGSFAANGLDKMRTMYNLCSKGNLHPDLILSQVAPFEYYEKVLAANERFTDTTVGDAGFQNLLFKAAVWMYDSYCPSGDMFMLTSQHIKLFYHPQYNFAQGKFIEPVNVAAEVAKILWLGNLTIDNAARQGRLGGITA